MPHHLPASLETIPGNASPFRPGQLELVRVARTEAALQSERLGWQGRATGTTGAKGIPGIHAVVPPLRPKSAGNRGGMGLAVPLRVETEGEDGRAGTLGSNFGWGRDQSVPIRGVARAWRARSLGSCRRESRAVG